MGPFGEIVSGGQDSLVRRFILSDSIIPSTGSYSEVIEPSFPHSHWVVSVTSLPPGAIESFPAGAIVSGCRDGIIRLFSLDSEKPVELSGHTGGVISFSWTEDYKLLSGQSIDNCVVSM